MEKSITHSVVTLWLFINIVLVATSATGTNTLEPCDDRNISLKHCGFRNCLHGACKGPNYCKCYRGWRGIECKACCNLTCGEHGVCDITFNSGKDDVTRCICDVTHTGDLCEVERCLRECTYGKCTFQGGRQVCQCHQGYLGEDCDREYNFLFIMTLTTGILPICPSYDVVR